MKTTDELASIEAVDAVIHYNAGVLEGERPAVFVARRFEKFRNGGVRGTDPSCAPGCRSDFGAHNTVWRQQYSDADRVSVMMDYALELCVKGCDPAEVVRQCCKVRQFYEQGADSFPMRRAISEACHGAAREDWPPGSGENGPMF